MLLQHKQRHKQVQTKQRNIKHQPSGANNEKQSEEQKQTQYRTIWLLAALAISIAGIIVFLLTENMSYKMTLIDHWTIVNAILFVAEALCIAFVFKSKKTPRKQEPHKHIASNNHL